MNITKSENIRLSSENSHKNSIKFRRYLNKFYNKKLKKKDLLSILNTIIQDKTFNKFELDFHTNNKNSNEKLVKYLHKQYGLKYFDRYDLRYLLENGSDNFICPICNRRYTKTVKLGKRLSKTCQNKECMSILGQQSKKQTLTSLSEKEYKRRNKRIRKKYEETSNLRFGVPIPSQSQIIKDKVAKDNLEKYGTEKGYNATEEGRQKLVEIQNRKEIRDKVVITNRERYGCDYYIQSKEGKKKASKVQSSKEVRVKSKKTCLERYGVEHYNQSKEGRKRLKLIQNSEEHKLKIYNTMKKNNTFNSSKSEDKVYKLLKKYFPKVIRQYKSKDYPFNCDFYIPINDLYIECNFHWTHGKEPYNKKNKEHRKKLKKWKKKGSQYYKIAANVWSKTDVSKREHSSNNDLNWLEFFNYDEILMWLRHRFTKSYYKNLKIGFDKDTLFKEYKNIHKSIRGYEAVSNKNKIILHSQPYFYNRERALWESSKKARYALVANRRKYINKDYGILTSQEIVRGFKISGKVNGYSHFCYEWMMQFIKDYKVTSIYDPFAGWGHRLIASSNLRYHGNDINKELHSGYKNIVDLFSLKNKSFSCKDSSSFFPKGKFDAIFTCPPYYNTEIYTDIGAENFSSKKLFFKWWKKVIKQCLKVKPRIFGIVVNHVYLEDFIENTKLKLLDKITLGKRLNHFQHTCKQSNKDEFLLIFKPSNTK